MAHACLPVSHVGNIAPSVSFCFQDADYAYATWLGILTKIRAFSTCTNSIIHLFYPTKFCIIIVCNFSWDMKMSKTMPMQIFLGLEAVYYGIVQVENASTCKKFASTSKRALI